MVAHRLNEYDVALGLRIAAYRRELDMSQSDLAKEVGVTFQQIQKYEHGANRVSFSRLVNIAEALETSVCALSDGIGAANPHLPMEIAHLKLLDDPSIRDVVDMLGQIRSPKQRAAVMRLVRATVED